jgi:hypothetical protein
MASLWVKVYYEILDDFKYHNIPDDSKLLMYELFLLTRKMHAMDNGGLLPGKEEIAFQLRRSPEFIESAMIPLLRLNIVSTNGEGYIITKFTDRQKADDPKDKMKAFRKRADNVTTALPICYDSVTNGNIDIDIDKELNKEIENTRERENPPHPIIQEIKKITGYYPKKETWQFILEKLKDGDESRNNKFDPVFFKQVYDAWLLEGNKPTNINGMIDWYLKDALSSMEARV